MELSNFGTAIDVLGAPGFESVKIGPANDRHCVGVLRPKKFEHWFAEAKDGPAEMFGFQALPVAQGLIPVIGVLIGNAVDHKYT